MSALANAFRTVKIFVKQNLPSILSYGAVGGIVVTSAFAIKGTEKELSNRCATAQDTIKNYIPMFVSGAITAGLIVASDRIHLDREAKLIFSYNLLNSQFTEYRKVSDKMLEGAGIGAGAVTAEMAKNQEMPKDDIPETRDGEILHWFYDDWSEIFFKASWNEVHDAMQAIQEDYALNGYVPVKKYYRILYERTGSEALLGLIRHLSDDIVWDCEALANRSGIFVPYLIINEDRSLLTPDCQEAIGLYFEYQPEAADLTCYPFKNY